MNSHFHNPKFLSLLATLGIVGQLVLLASAWLLPSLSEYSLVGDNISELVLGRYGFIQTSAFLIGGLGTLGVAVAIRGTTVGTKGSIVGSLLLGINGLAMVLVSFIPTDRIDSAADLSSLSTTGVLHITLAIIAFLAIIVAMFVLTWTFIRKARRQSSARWLMFFPAGALALFFVQAQGPLVGLMQRLLVTIMAIWLILAALKVRSFVAQRGAA